MSELDKQLVYAVDRDNAAAWAAVMKIAESKPRLGQFIPLTAAEFEALKSGVLVLQIPSIEEKRSSRPTLYEYDKYPCGCHLWYYDRVEVDRYIAAIERDAKRYRWLRENPAFDTEAFLSGLSPERFDEVVDDRLG